MIMAQTIEPTGRASDSQSEAPLGLDNVPPSPSSHAEMSADLGPLKGVRGVARGRIRGAGRRSLRTRGRRGLSATPATLGNAVSNASGPAAAALVVPKRKRGRPPRNAGLARPVVTPSLAEIQPALDVSPERPESAESPSVIPENISRLLEQPPPGLNPAREVLYEKDPLEEDLGLASGSGSPSETDSPIVRDASPVLTPALPAQLSESRPIDEESSSTPSSQTESRTGSPTTVSRPGVTPGRGRPRGRPPGSRGRGRGQPAVRPRGRGRPKGSSNLTRLLAEAKEHFDPDIQSGEDALTRPKRGPGRPPNPLPLADPAPPSTKPVNPPSPPKTGMDASETTRSPDRDPDGDESLDSAEVTPRRKNGRSLRPLRPKNKPQVADDLVPSKRPVPDETDQSSDEPLVPINSSILTGPSFNVLGNREARLCLDKLGAKSPIANGAASQIKPTRAYPKESKKGAFKDVNDINSLPETKKEIRERLKSFSHIRDNQFLCER